MKKGLVSLAIIGLLAGCSVSIKGNTPSKNVSYPQEAEMQADDFVYKLYTEKETYNEFEETAIYAELTYVGDQESIVISHAASPFYFPIKELTRNYEIDYAMNEPLIHTTLKKGVPLKVKYEFAGGYSDEDEAAKREFIQTIVDKGFPTGKYVVSGSAQFYVESSIEGENPNSYDMRVNIGFDVR
ncbi:hypothetical protein [Sporosarcina sp. OR05]|uniref:hypothetical protein n=1 Tax=Sporosarcina sp. OR05 TaxID=2969819 RepID=UPI00352AEA62